MANNGKTLVTKRGPYDITFTERGLMLENMLYEVLDGFRDGEMEEQMEGEIGNCEKWW